MYGIPDILHVDHGSDSTSHHLERTALALHVRIIHSTSEQPDALPDAQLSDLHFGPGESGATLLTRVHEKFF